MNLSDLFFWKHKEQPHIIKQECYDKLPEHHRVNYEKTKYTSTHKVENVDRTSDEDDGIIFTALATAATLDMMEDNTSTSYDMGGSYDSSDSSSDFDGFGGGDTGGGGASGDW